MPFKIIEFHRVEKHPTVIYCQSFLSSVLQYQSDGEGLFKFDHQENIKNSVATINVSVDDLSGDLGTEFPILWKGRSRWEDLEKLG